MNLNPKQRHYLKSEAHSMKPILIVGKEGCSPSFLKELKQIINLKELIKVKVPPKAALSEKPILEIIQEYDSEILVVGQIGRNVILFKLKKKESTYTLP